VLRGGYGWRAGAAGTTMTSPRRAAARRVRAIGSKLHLQGKLVRRGTDCIWHNWATARLPGCTGVPQALRSPTVRISATHLRHRTLAYRSPSELETTATTRSESSMALVVRSVPRGGQPVVLHFTWAVPTCRSLT
jgi:hypothetical protein